MCPTLNLEAPNEEQEAQGLPGRLEKALTFGLRGGDPHSKWGSTRRVGLTIRQKETLEIQLIKRVSIEPDTEWLFLNRFREKMTQRQKATPTRTAPYRCSRSPAATAASR